MEKGQRDITDIDRRRDEGTSLISTVSEGKEPRGFPELLTTGTQSIELPQFSPCGGWLTLRYWPTEGEGLSNFSELGMVPRNSRILL